MWLQECLPLGSNVSQRLEKGSSRDRIPARGLLRLRDSLGRVQKVGEVSNVFTSSGAPYGRGRSFLRLIDKIIAQSAAPLLDSPIS